MEKEAIRKTNSIIIEYCDENNVEEIALATAYNKIGLVLQKLGVYDCALVEYRKALVIHEKMF